LIVGRYGLGVLGNSKIDLGRPCWLLVILSYLYYALVSYGMILMNAVESQFVVRKKVLHLHLNKSNPNNPLNSFPLFPPLTQMQLHAQRWFLKNSKNLLSLRPAQTLRHTLQLKIPRHSRHNQSHLRICQILPYTISRSMGKRVHTCPVIVCEFGVVERVGAREPPFGDEGVGVQEVVRAVIGRPLVDPDFGLSLLLVSYPDKWRGVNENLHLPE